MPKPQRMDMSAIARAWSMGVDFVINLVAGGLLGFGLDWIFGTKPILMIVFALLGLSYGMLRFIRDALAFNREVSHSNTRGASETESEE